MYFLLVFMQCNFQETFILQAVGVCCHVALDYLILFYEYTIVYLFVLIQMDLWISSSFWWLQTVLLWLFCIRSGRYAHEFHLEWICCSIGYVFPSGVPIYTRVSYVWELPLLHVHQPLDIVTVLILSVCWLCNRFRLWFWFAFPWSPRSWAFFHANWLLKKIFLKYLFKSLARFSVHVSETFVKVLYFLCTSFLLDILLKIFSVLWVLFHFLL